MSSISKWWKIQCLDCGVNCDLLTDKASRIICRECLEKHEFNEVKDAIDSEEEDHEEVSDERPEVERKESKSWYKNFLRTVAQNGGVYSPGSNGSDGEN